MNKKISKDENGGERAPSTVGSYFTEEINNQIREMTPKQMQSILKEMISTPYWIAILKYVGMRTPILDATLRGTNPSVDPSKISWAQGCLAGMSDLEGYVIELNSSKVSGEEVEGDRAEPRAEGVIIG